VKIDLSSVGDSSNQTMYDDGTHGDGTSGDYIYSYEVTVATNATLGMKYLTVTAYDSGDHVSNTEDINLLIESPVKINEIMYDPEGANTGNQWIELYNDGSRS
ncbi:unnamed protein product, partial [marine sediment metagenome]